MNAHLRSCCRIFGFVMSGRFHFLKQRLGEVIADAQGMPFTVFRQVAVDPGKDQPEKPGAIFTIRFQVTNIPPWLNRRFSLLPTPLYAGMHGFRSKRLTINGSW